MFDISEGKETFAVLAPFDASCAEFEYIDSNIVSDICARDLSLCYQYAGCNCPPGLGCCTDADRCVCLQRCGGASYGPAGRRLEPAEADALVGGHEKPVLECNAACSCSSLCPNRVVQCGQQLPLEIFPTPGKGYGLRTAVPVARGTFVCEYVGEVLTVEEARMRATHCDRRGGATYLLALREHLGSGQPLVTYVDAERYGNAARFINHSCEPNLDVVAVRVDNAVPHVALFAKRDIDAREELTFSYGTAVLGKDVDEQRQQPWCAGAIDTAVQETRGQQEPKVCLCRASTCQGRLPYDAELFS